MHCAWHGSYSVQTDFNLCGSDTIHLHLAISYQDITDVPQTNARNNQTQSTPLETTTSHNLITHSNTSTLTTTSNTTQTTMGYYTNGGYNTTAVE